MTYLSLRSVVFLLFPYALCAQIQIDISKGCAYTGPVNNLSLSCYPASAELVKIVREVSLKQGGEVNIETFSSNDLVEKAIVYQYNGNYYLVISKQFEKYLLKKRWDAYSILSHLINHASQKHDLINAKIGERKIYELEADAYAGRAIRKFGGLIEEAQMAIMKYILQNAKAGFPPKTARLESTFTGWKNEDAANAPVVSPSDVDKWVPDLVFVEGGTFMMGDSTNRLSQPIHSVTVPDFFIGKYEVTNAEFATFLNEISNDITIEADAHRVFYEGECIFYLFCGYKKGVCNFTENIEYSKGNTAGGTFLVRPGFEHHPVFLVSWYGANAYLKWLSTKVNRTFRLPTEAEWEYAAKGGTKTLCYIYSGSNNLDTIAWTSGMTTHPIGTKLPNELGIFDMTGNVNEFCMDCFHPDYKKTPQDGSACTTPYIEGTSSCQYIFRGGSFDVVYKGWENSQRNAWLGIGAEIFAIGLRIVMDNKIKE